VRTWGRQMKNFNKIKISYSEKSMRLLFSTTAGFEDQRVEVILDVSRDNIPLGIEWFVASELDAAKLASIRTALINADVRFAHDVEEDIMTINVNAIDEDARTQRPGQVVFSFDAQGGLVSMVVT